MKRLGYIAAVLGALAIVAPTMTNAETVVIKRHHHGPYGARAEFRDHGWHRGWHHGWHRGDRTVVIKRSHRHWD